MVNKSQEKLYLREKLIIEKNDPLPAKDKYWDNEGLNKTKLSNGIFVSELTKEIEVIYVNTEEVHTASAFADFQLLVT